MNAGGIVVVIVGVWLGVQVFGGNMLERLGVVPTPAPSSSSKNTPTAAGAPAGGSTTLPA